MTRMTPASFARRTIRRNRVLQSARRRRDRRMLDDTDHAPRDPDFVGIGVQKAATKRWFSLITDHPDVAGPRTREKELHAFDSSGLSTPTGSQLDDYRREFAHPAHLTVGEWTPRYQFDPWAVPQLVGAFPKVKLITILRDPLERMLSGLTHHAHRHGTPTASDVSEAFTRSLYGAQLEPILRVVPSAQLLVLQYEQLNADAAATLRRTYEFLDLDPSHVPTGLHEVVGAARVDRFDLDDGARRVYADRFADDRGRLRQLDLGLDFSLWSS